jgi:hypothetical protein
VSETFSSPTQNKSRVEAIFTSDFGSYKKGDFMACTLTARDAAIIKSGLKILTDEQLELALVASIRCLDAWRKVHDLTLFS